MRSAFLMIKAVRKAESVMMRDFMEVEKLQTSVKGAGDFVTATDLRLEDIIYRELSYMNPTYSFIMEERGSVEPIEDSDDPSVSYRYIVDALDGTFNFMHGVPYFAISVALERTKGDYKDIVAAVVHSPVTRETFWAEKGSGAYCIGSDSNEYRIRTASSNAINAKQMFVVSNSTVEIDSSFVHSVMAAGPKVRVCGSISLDACYLAVGRYNALFYSRSNIWDRAAGMLIVSEAGGLVKNMADVFPESGSGYLFASSVGIMNGMLKIYENSLSKGSQ